VAKTIRIHLSPAVLAVTAVAIAGAVGCAIWLAGLAQDCHARWRDSGLRVQFRDWQCLVEASGRIYPEHVIRIHVREPG
jgi:hypothetical protein